MTQSPIPTLNFQDFVQGNERQKSAFVQGLGNALADIGFFILVNPPVEATLIRSAYDVATAFFALPETVKHQYEQLALKGQRGFTRFGREHAKDSPMPDLKEFWHVGREGSTGTPLTHLPNLWPQEVPSFRPVLLQLYRQLDDCAAVLLEACSLYLGYPRPWLKAMVTGGDTILRVIHYPPLPANVPPASLRAAPHEDINFITLLCEATEPGLELLQRDGTWLPITAQPGQIVVDTGDMLQQLTNGLFKSTTHRVSNPAREEMGQTQLGGLNRSRFSMPFFVHPRQEIDLTPVPGCIAQTGGSPKFPSLTAGEYLRQRLQEIGLS